MSEHDKYSENLAELQGSDAEAQKLLTVLEPDQDKRLQLFRQLKDIIQNVHELSKKNREELFDTLYIEDPQIGMKVVLGTRYGERPLEEIIDPISHLPITENIELSFFLLLLKEQKKASQEFVSRFSYFVNYQRESFYEHIKNITENELAPQEAREMRGSWLRAMDLTHVAKLLYFQERKIREDDRKESVFERLDGADLVRGGRSLDLIWSGTKESLTHG